MVSLRDADVLVFMEFPSSPDIVREAKACAPNAKIIVILIESPLDKAHWFHPGNYSLFDKVLTYYKGMVDDKIFLPFVIPIGEKNNKFIPEANYEARKKLVVINGNKYTGWRSLPPWSPWAYPSLINRLKGWRIASMRAKGISIQELYSRRRRIIRLAERMMPDQIDVWGSGWQNPQRLWWQIWGSPRPFLSARGLLGSKLAMSGNYCFSLCFENCRNNVGYISEKIVDSLYCGFVPIYLGAENIGDYFPPNTYVDARQFRTDRHLLEFVRSCPKEKWQNMHHAGQQFIATRGHAPLLPDVFANNLNRILLDVTACAEESAR